jgi:hypothetical protein
MTGFESELAQVSACGFDGQVDDGAAQRRSWAVCAGTGAVDLAAARV